MSAVLYFDIGDSGVNVDSIEYGLYLSEFPLSSIPHTNTFTNVLNYNSVVYPSLYDPSDTSGVPIYTRAGPILNIKTFQIHRLENTRIFQINNVVIMNADQPASLIV